METANDSLSKTKSANDFIQFAKKVGACLRLMIAADVTVSQLSRVCENSKLGGHHLLKGAFRYPVWMDDVPLSRFRIETRLARLKDGSQAIHVRLIWNYDMQCAAEFIWSGSSGVELSNFDSRRFLIYVDLMPAKGSTLDLHYRTPEARKVGNQSPWENVVYSDPA